MPKTKIVIIEDEFFAAEHLSDLVTSLGYWVVGVYHSGEEFLSQTDWRFDAAIVDIFLSDEMTGLSVAARIKERSKPFMFLTANQDTRTLKEAARLAPVSYITKPFKTNDVSAALEMITFQMAPKIKIRGANGIEELDSAQLLFVKSDGVYIELHTLKGMIVQRKLLKEIIDELPDSFIRVHRSYLVNRDHIEHRAASHIGVRGHEIPVSRSFKENLDF